MKPIRKLSKLNILRVVATILGDEFQVNEAHLKLNNVKHGYSIYIDVRDRTTISGSTYFRDKYGKAIYIDSYPHLKDFAEAKYTESITISSDRSCKDLVVELSTRFLPNYEPVVIKLKEKINQINDKHDQVVMAYKDLCHEASHYLDPKKIKEPIKSYSIPKRGINIRLNEDLDLTTLHLEDIEVDTCKKILRILTE